MQEQSPNSQGPSDAQMEQYRQAAEDRRQFDSAIWQYTLTPVLTVVVAAAAVVLRDISDGFRSAFLLVVSLSLLTLLLALHKHRFGTDTRTEALEAIEHEWVNKGLISKMVQRKTNASPEMAVRMYYKEPSGLNRLGAVAALKALMSIFAAALLLLTATYFGSALGCWDLPQFLENANSQADSTDADK